MQAPVELAQRIAAPLGEIEGIVAVALGGSWARGEGHSGSDVGLGIYYRDEHRPSIEELHRLAQELGYRYPAELVTASAAGSLDQRRGLAPGSRNTCRVALSRTGTGLPRYR